MSFNNLEIYKIVALFCANWKNFESHFSIINWRHKLAISSIIFFQISSFFFFPLKGDRPKWENFSKIIHETSCFFRIINEVVPWERNNFAIGMESQVLCRINYELMLMKIDFFPFSFVWVLSIVLIQKGEQESKSYFRRILFAIHYGIKKFSDEMIT